MADKKTNKTNSNTQPKSEQSKKQRKIRHPKKSYNSFKLSKRIKHPEKLPKARTVFAKTYRVLKGNSKLFGGIIAVFFVLSLVFVRGTAGGVDIAELQMLFTELFTGVIGQLIGSAAILSIVAGDVTSAPTDVAGAYQSMLFVIVSLAAIYAIRKTVAGEPVKLLESFYRSAHPLIPFLLVLFVIGLQLLPLAIGSWLFSTVVNTGLAVHAVEQLAWAIIFFLLALLSLYMITSSLFALYIVTLPDMRPLQALRSARELVRFRRWTVMRKVLFLPFSLIVIGIIALLPFALFLAPVAEFAVLIFMLASVIFSHAYMYNLYRELL